MITFEMIGNRDPISLPWLPHLITVVKTFVLTDADINTVVFKNPTYTFEEYDVYIGLEESPLSLMYRNEANRHFEECCKFLQSSDLRRCLLISFLSGGP